MNIFFPFNLILILNYVLAEVEWNIVFNQYDQVLNPEGLENKMSIFQGKYFPLYVEIIPAVEDPKRARADLYLKGQSEYILAKSLYQIDTSISQQIKIEIGVSCDSQNFDVEKNLTFSLVSEDKSIFLISELSISYKNISSFTNVLPYYMATTKIPSNGYGTFYTFSDQIKNVDELQITFENQNSEDGTFFNSLVINPFNSSYPGKMFLTKFGFVSTTEEEEEEASENFKYKINVESKCFRVEKSLVTFSLTGEKFSPISSIANSIAKSAFYSPTEEQSTLEIRMNIDISPIEVYCTITKDSSAFIDDDEIISQARPIDKTELQYNYQYFTEPGEKSFIYKGLSQYVEYKTRCLFRSPKLNFDKKTDSLPITIGTNNSDIKLPLEITEDAAGDPSYCMTWIFKRKIRRNFFIDLVTEYCTEFFSSALITRDSNGCLQCVLRDASDVYETKITEDIVSMCVKPEDGCLSRFQEGDLGRKFSELARSLDSSEDFHELFNISETDYSIRDFFKESDEQKPKKHLIKFSQNSFQLNETHVSFEAYTTEEKKIECYALVDMISEVGLSRSMFSERFMIDNDQESKTVYVVPFSQAKERYDGFEYNLIIDCYNIPNYDYSFEHTSPFVLAQFNKLENAFPKRQKMLASSCTNQPFISECFKIKSRSLMNLQSKIILENNINIFQSFGNLNVYEKLHYINDEIRNIDTEKPPMETVDLLNKLILINDLNLITKCRTFIDYQDCRKKKISLNKGVLTVIDKKFIQKGIVSVLGGDEKEKKVKLFLTLLYFLTGNIEGFDIDAFKTLVNFYSNVNTNLEKLINLSSTFIVQQDILRLFVGCLNDALDIIHFNEIDHQIQKVNEYTGFLNEGSIKELLAIINSLRPVMYKHKFNNSVFSNTEFHFKEIQDMANITYVYFDSFKINVTLPVNYLTEKTKAKYASFVLYRHYPFRSFILESKKSPLTVSVKIYDESHNEIMVDNLSSNNHILIEFHEISHHSLMFCYYYDEKQSTEKFEHKGISTDQDLVTEGTIKCVANQVGDFTLGDYDIGGKIYFAKMGAELIVLFVILGGLTVIGVVLVFLRISRYATTNPRDSDVVEGFFKN